MKNTTEQDIPIPERSQWMRLLSALDTEKLMSQVDAVSKGWQISPKALPQSGLGMLKLQDSACNEPFFLGEIPLCTAWLEILTPDGRKTEGAAQIMNDNIDLVQALAVCDTILANQLPGYERIVDLLDQGNKICNQEKQRRKMMLAKTRVDFSLLDDVGDDDEN
ncbi:MAG: phosphonate C-P lyase system protein PhnG [Thermodesulfobacteriota bacterium]|nr:phosphonate C-P lyase system protein PhnG [Thermodesulfobacteriota bacterium]